MILTVPVLHPWGKPTEFQAQLQAGVKTSLIVRENLNWEAGMVIDFMTDKPTQFFHIQASLFADKWVSLPVDDTFADKVEKPLVAAIEHFQFHFEQKKSVHNFNVYIKIGGFKVKTFDLIDLLATYTGFSNALELCNHFRAHSSPKVMSGGFVGQLLHLKASNVFDQKAAQYA